MRDLVIAAVVIPFIAIGGSLLSQKMQSDKRIEAAPAQATSTMVTQDAAKRAEMLHQRALEGELHDCETRGYGRSAQWSSADHESEMAFGCKAMDGFHMFPRPPCNTNDPRGYTDACDY